MQYDVSQSKAKLSRLMKQAEAGEEVIIARRGKPAVRLVPVATLIPRVLGMGRGEFVLPEGWEKPMADAEAESFFAGR